MGRIHWKKGSVILLALLGLIVFVWANTTPQTLPFTQNWTDTGLITADDNWSGVAGIVGYRGDNLTSTTGIDPQTVLAADDAGVIDVVANITNPSGNSSGGVGECEIADPVVALQGSGTADAPYIKIYLVTTGKSNISVSYNVRDVDGSADNATQQVALHYRVGGSGSFTNIPAAYIADATTGPSQATLVTPVSVTLPAACENQSLVELRIMTTNAAGNDEWVGIDDINITGTSGNQLSINDVSWTEGEAGTETFTFNVSLSAPAGAGGVSFDITTADGTATTADNDYVANSITGALIAEGNSIYAFYVTVNGDTAAEADETFYVNVTNVTGATLGDGTGLGTILDDDTINLSINDVTVTEGDAGTTTAAFAVTLSRPALSGGVSFDIATADGTATVADNDYVAIPLTGVTIPEGQTQYAFNVLVNGDATNESTETFSVNVTNASGTNVTVADGTGAGTITNDDMPYTPIHTVQGSGSESPYKNQTVTTRGIVTARKYNGYFIQSRESLYDEDPDTSEGLQVFTTTAPPSQIVVGDDVVVTGTVSEYIPNADTYSPPLTELTSSTVNAVLYSGVTLPDPIVLTAADTSPAGSIEQLEKYEGMLVEIPSLTTISPTQGSITESSATATSNGTFYGVITGIDRPAREPGIEAPEPIPTEPCCIPRFDGNPERLRVDTDAIDGTSAANLTTGVEITNLVGPLDYGYRTYTILAQSGWSATDNIEPIPVVMGSPSEATIASFNMLRFFDTVNDPDTSDAVLTATAFNNRLAKASLIFRTILQLPDIVGVQEVENLTTLQAIAAKINADVVAGGGTDPQYVAYLEEGNDVGGIDVGFLVKSTRVTVDSVVQYGKDTIFSFPGSDDAPLNDRPPLVLDGTVNLDNETMPLLVIVNHLRSLGSIDDPTDGPRVRAKRQAQAEYLADLIQDFQAADPDVLLASLGDYNAYPFNDGYVDVMGTVRGDPVPADEVLVQVSNDLVDPDLIDLMSTIMAGDAYSYTYDGNTQALDHILVNRNLRNQLDSFQVARINADFPQIYYGDPARPEKLSDHDPEVAYFSWNTPLRGDLNLDGFVDSADLLLFANYFAGNDVILDGSTDLNFSGATDLADLVWLQNEVGGNNPAK